MTFTHHEIYFNITRTNTFLDNLGSFLNRNPVVYNPSAIMPDFRGSSASAILKQVINLLIRLIKSFITMFTLPNPLVQKFCNHWTFTSSVAFNTYDFRAQFLLRKPMDGLFFHLGRKLSHLVLNGMSMICFTQGIGRNIIISCSSSLGKIPAQFSVYSG